MVDQNVVLNIQRDPLNTLKSMTVENIVSMLEAADDAFFNTDQTIFSDDIYDMIKEYLKKQDPKNLYLKKVGMQIKFNKETLPFYLGSLDKIKDDEKEIERWKNKYSGDVIISEKLDGISCLLYYENSRAKLLTRGNGYEGQNITHILPYLNIDLSKLNDKIAIRGELIISRSDWEKNSHVGANARNVVAGLVHSKTINAEVAPMIQFVAYDVLYPRSSLSMSLRMVTDANISVVRNVTLKRENLNIEKLSDILQEWRKTSLYEIDGIVVHDDKAHKLTPGKNPKYAFAFKTILTHEKAEVIVTDVVWNISKHRYAKPLVKFNEVTLSGVKIKQATGFNAAYIQNNKIGPGSRIIIVRSGDVIPHILSVLTPASIGQGKMPEFEYIWSDTGVDIMIPGSEKNRDQDIKAFVHFMNTLSVDGVKEGVIKKFYDAGFDSLSKILKMTYDDIIQIEGFKDKSATNISQSLGKIKCVECHKLMAASNIFGRGFGEKKIKMIIDKYPFIIKDKKRTEELTVFDIMNVDGVAKISAEQFIQFLPQFMIFYEEMDIKCGCNINPTAVVVKKNIFEGKKIVFSGFRNKEWEKMIEQSNGKIVTSISKSADYLVVKDKNAKTSKIQMALDAGVTIVSQDEFEDMIKNI